MTVSTRSFGARLSLPHVAMLVALPLLLFGGVVLGMYVMLQSRAAENDRQYQADVARLAVERLLDAELQALATLAAAPALDDGDLDAFREYASRTLAAHPHWVDVVLTDRDNRLLGARGAVGPSLSTSSVGSVERVFASGRPEIGGVVRDPAWADEPVVVLRVPVIRGGEIRYTLAAGLRAWTVRNLLQARAPGPDRRFAVLDAEGRLLARSTSTEPDDPAVGLPPPGDLAQAVRGAGEGRGEGHFSARAMDGLWFDGYATRTAPAGWTVLSGRPGGRYLTPIPWTAVVASAGGVLAAALATGLALVLGRALARRDAAERRLRELSLERAVESRLTEVAANFPGVLYRKVRHPDGRTEYPYVSPSLALARLIGSASPAGADLLDAFRRNLTPESRRLYERVESSRGWTGPLEVEYALEVGGRRIWLQSLSRPRFDPRGHVVWDGVVLDVTAQKRVEAELRASEERLRLALDAAQLGMFDQDEPLGAITWSGRHRAIFGVAEDEPVTRETFWSRVHPADAEEVREAARRAYDPAGDGELKASFRIVLPGGETRWISSRGRATFVGSGGGRRPVRLTGIVSDVTDGVETRRAVEAAREAAERANGAKSRFLAAASHDLRQPVQALSLLLPALDPHVDALVGKRILATAQDAAGALRDLLDTLLDMSRLDANVVEPRVEDVPLARVLDGLAMLRPAATDKGLRLEVARTGLVVRSDATLLGRMLRNLVENAIKYTEEGRVSVTCRAAGGSVRVRIQDTGVGIAKEHLERIWSEFEQVGNPERDRARGLGLGLSIVQRLSRLLGHGVDVRSRPGEGSTFTVTLPLAEVAAGDAPAAWGGAEAPAAPPRRLSLLLVEDDALVRAGLELTLREWGHEVVAAATASQAVEAIRARGEPPDMVLADYRLGGGETGLGAIAAVRRAVGGRGPRIPAVVLTGETGREALATIHAAGHAVLSKPVTADALRAALATAPDPMPATAGAA
jgi:PAS domain S-box-containing protein